MKIFFLFFLMLQLLEAQHISKRQLLGNWEFSPLKSRDFVSFGNYVGTQRGESLELLFNKANRVKVLTTDDIYAYEILRDSLKIYKLRKTHNNKWKKTHKYDTFKIVGKQDGCYILKVSKKKIIGVNTRKPFKMCKTSNYPQSLYTHSASEYEF